MLLLFVWMFVFWGWLVRACAGLRGGGHPVRRRGTTPVTRMRSHAKPAWVKTEIIRLKARMPKAGCRAIAGIFNRRHGPVVTVGKSYVAGLLKRNAHEVWRERRRMRNRRPGNMPRNLIWGMDMTGKTDAAGNLHMILGLVDHGSRFAVELARLPDKQAWTLLLHLIQAVRRHGRPRFIRTDNESVFGAPLFRLGLAILGIRRQQTEPHCPWQNGRVERFFGTLKEPLDQRPVADGDQLDRDLSVFRTWYNRVRPHQNLNGRTPHEAWNGVDPYARRIRIRRCFSAWDGLLQGEVYLL